MPCFPPLPKRYSDALVFVRETLPPKELFGEHEVWIAGGALRDLVIPRAGATKDIDVFVFSEAPLPIAVYFADQIGLRDRDITDSSGPAGSFRTLVYAVENPSQLGLDVIFLKEQQDILALLDTFDIGICKLAADGRRWVIHQDFLDDLAARVIKVRGYGAYDKGSVLARVERFAGYYPDFAVDTSFFAHCN